MLVVAGIKGASAVQVVELQEIGDAITLRCRHCNVAWQRSDRVETGKHGWTDYLLYIMMTSPVRYSLSNHRSIDCLFKNQFRLSSKKSNPALLDICGDNLLNGGFHSQRSSNTENIYMAWCLHDNAKHKPSKTKAYSMGYSVFSSLETRC